MQRYFGGTQPALVGVSLFSLIWLAGCGASTSSQAKQMVYVDTVTLQASVRDVSTTIPAINPATGKATLRPGLYCTTCGKWYPTPDVEQVNRVRGAGLCPKDKTALTTEGPWPDGTNAPAGTSK